MTALAIPATWVERRTRGAGRRAACDNGSSSEDRRTGVLEPIAGLDNGSSSEDLPAGVVQPIGAGDDGASRPAGLDDAIVGFNDVADAAVRRSARTLHAACAELLPGYSAASREPWRQALLTAGCLDAHPRRPAQRRLSAPPLIVEEVVQPSDVLCALWLARRCGLFSPGSPCGDGVGLRSACEIVPEFAPTLAQQRRADVLEVLRANTAWRAHRLARAA